MNIIEYAGICRMYTNTVENGQVMLMQVKQLVDSIKQFSYVVLAKSKRLDADNRCRVAPLRSICFFLSSNCFTFFKTLGLWGRGGGRPSTPLPDRHFR